MPEGNTFSSIPTILDGREVVLCNVDQWRDVALATVSEYGDKGGFYTRTIREKCDYDVFVNKILNEDIPAAR